MFTEKFKYLDPTLLDIQSCLKTYQKQEKT